MSEALMLVQFLSAAVTAGANVVDVLSRVSTLIAARAAAGQVFSSQDLLDLLDVGDALEVATRAQFAKTLADPNTPKR
ncbi:MAG: hypothetical protein HY661_07680 [Betaproteobacteria bacterium]|nr:hypothetical protein [Betaproteobacteria bacterium]